MDYGSARGLLRHPEFREVLTDGTIGRILNAASIIKKLAPEIVQTSLDWSNVTLGIAAVSCRRAEDLHIRPQPRSNSFRVLSVVHVSML